MTASARTCLECGIGLTGRRGGKEFCSQRCRQSFNNRRMQRGAELYDLFRALRRDRGEAKDRNVWTLICQLEKRWQDEDEKTRQGRRSYMPPERVIPHLLDKGSLPRGEVLSRSYRAGR